MRYAVVLLAVLALAGGTARIALATSRLVIAVQDSRAAQLLERELEIAATIERVARSGGGSREILDALRTECTDRGERLVVTDDSSSYTIETDSGAIVISGGAIAGVSVRW